ncbi:tetratricopeptide repeat protein [Planctomyces sp. SH-PL62]|uniref:tetratricopeptide repeat protein n=1 Tax=Planctomyces sp. SH-PL62 TaxID=1636152 RepID=UPI00078D3717|nr:tetratricopeptide repeat protein [Planctomyces sp. SH-PL62]AMV38477.1 Tetratricopeptide repeat protein [Planctomyces sp. SH-PL62]
MDGTRKRWFAWAALAAIVATAVALGWIATRPPDPSRLLAEAQADFQAGRLEAAATALDRLAAVRPPTPMDHMARAQVAQARGLADDALAEAAAIFENPALGPLARLLAGRVEVERHRLRAAEAHFLKAAEAMPREAQPYEELAYIDNLQHRWDDFDRVMLALSDRGGLSFQRLLHWGKARHATWNPREDCLILAKCVEADPDDRASRLVLADGLRRMNQIEEAEAVLAPLPDSDAEALALRALLAVEREDDDEAERRLRKGPPDDPHLAQVRGRLALKRGDADGAVRAFRLALEASPHDRAVLHGLGTALRLAGDPDAAAKCFEVADRHDAITPLILRAATAAGAADPTLPAQLGAACAAAGRIPEAIAWSRLALANNPLDREAQQAVYRLERQLDPH